jgi:hypothetical protein
MLTMTYGKLPTFSQFRTAFERDTPEGVGYRIVLGPSDLVLATRVGLDNGDGVYLDGTHSVASLWAALHALTHEWEVFGDEEAGDFASAILISLNIEWV